MSTLGNKLVNVNRVHIRRTKHKATGNVLAPCELASGPGAKKKLCALNSREIEQLCKRVDSSSVRSCENVLFRFRMRINN